MTKQIIDLLKINKTFYSSVREDFTYHSSIIEGSTITKDQHHQLSNLKNKQTIDDVNVNYESREDAIENLNCLKLFDYVFSNLNQSLSHQTICRYQKILKTNTQFELNLSNETGVYRKSDVKVGNHYPPNHFKVHERMEQLINNFNYRKTLLIDDVAEFHVQFENIHPFRDGNGRVGRMIAFKQCLQNNVIPFIVNQETRSTYLNYLEIYNTNNDFLQLTKYFLDQQKIFIQKYHKYLKDNSYTENLSLNELKVIDYLKKHRYANRLEIQKYIGLKITATKRLLSNMVKKRLLKIIGGSKNSKYSIT